MGWGWGINPGPLTVSDLLPNSHAWHLGRSQGQSCCHCLLCPVNRAGDEEQKFQKLSITSYEECVVVFITRKNSAFKFCIFFKHPAFFFFFMFENNPKEEADEVITAEFYAN